MAKPTPPPSPVSAMTPTRPTNPPTITVQHGHAPSLWAEPAYIPSEYLTTSTSSPSQASAVQQSPRASPAQTTVSPTTTTPPIISTTTQAPTLMGHRQRPIPHQDHLPPHPSPILFPTLPSPVYETNLTPNPTNLTSNPTTDILSYVCNIYPHLNQSYLLMQYLPTSHLYGPPPSNPSLSP